MNVIKCNLCWRKLEAQEVCYITCCCHIFCMYCPLLSILTTLLKAMSALLSNSTKRGYAPIAIHHLAKGIVYC